MLKKSRHSGLQSFLNYALVASNWQKHKANTYIKSYDIFSILRLNSARNRPEKPGPTYDSVRHCLLV